MSGNLNRGNEILIFSDDFNELDFDVWRHEVSLSGYGNWEFQYYTNNRTNSYTEDGTLYIQPTLTEDYIGREHVGGEKPFTLDLWGVTPADSCTVNMFYGCSRSSDKGARLAINPVQSARLRTSGSFSFKYGRVEVRAKLPKGDWLWPAIWMLPEREAYGQWPASGEVDIMESRGNAAGYDAGYEGGASGGIDAFSSCIHWGPHYTRDGWDKTFANHVLENAKEGSGVGGSGSGRTLNDDFHIFGLHWDEEKLYTYIDTDDNRVLEVPFDLPFWERGNFEEGGLKDNPWDGRPPSAPYDKHFYLILNVAVGGVSGFFPDGKGGKFWTNKDTDAMMKFFEHTDSWYPTWHGTDAAMQVDYVRVWQRADSIDFYLDKPQRYVGSSGGGGDGVRGFSSTSFFSRGSDSRLAAGSASGNRGGGGLFVAGIAVLAATAGAAAAVAVMQWRRRRWQPI